MSEKKKRKMPAVFIHLPSVQIWYQVTQVAAHFCSTISGTIWLIRLHIKLNWNLFCHHNIGCHGYPPHSLTIFYRSKKKTPSSFFLSARFITLAHILDSLTNWWWIKISRLYGLNMILSNSTGPRNNRKNIFKYILE